MFRREEYEPIDATGATHQVRRRAGLVIVSGLCLAAFAAVYSASGDSLKTAATSDLLAVSMAGGMEPVLHGYDVVAYHFLEEGEEDIMGSPDFTFDVTTSYGDFTFWFSSQENMDIFASDPLAYTPAFGGFCTFALAVEDFINIDGLQDGRAPPSCIHSIGNWDIVDGRLYMSGCDASTYYITSEMDFNYYVELAETNWLIMFDGLEDGPFNNLCYGDGATKDMIGLCVDSELTGENPNAGDFGPPDYPKGPSNTPGEDAD